MPCAKFGWNCHSGFGADFFKNSVYIWYSITISHWKRACPSYEQTWIASPRMLCAMAEWFCWRFLILFVISSLFRYYHPLENDRVLNDSPIKIFYPQIWNNLYCLSTPVNKCIITWSCLHYWNMLLTQF